MKVAICAGHGGNNSTPGKRSPDNEFEWDFNNKVVLSAIAVLEASGAQVLRLDDASGKTDVPLKTRTDRANSWGADVYVSVHHNAVREGVWGDHGGTETYTQNGNYPSTERLAKEIHKCIVKAMGLRDRGLKKANFHITRETRMHAVLTEAGFMDSRTDIKVLRDDSKLRAQGEAIAEGILAHFGKKAAKPRSKKKSKASTGKASLPNSIFRAVRPYPKGSGVRRVQQALASLRFYPDRGARHNGIDGVYGPKTANAVRRFQSMHYGIREDGIYGPQTRKKLLELL
ncbi:N-acetylmuramoyl-L-alanine amidase [Shouchella lonarensis]|uniref:N-acetylmuramoyl-L-alanine amidase n=1 Tax=Shouchella lonarensis TaxID=1464122 RepID=A0A1G6HPJ9_9BACI|nr:N-acetylmuramoyl-L-alanine amidase [Shouchella lonarensis]SDB96162.1 N-acetylmuramoyl-L-alanine amidase [Shouchella lonarensis]